MIYPLPEAAFIVASAGAPSSGTYTIGQWGVDQLGSVWVCISAGSPGTWARNGEQFTVLSSSYTLTSTTSAQKLFNATSNGTVTLQPGAYFFECEFDLSSMSSTSGVFSFVLGGTATISSVRYTSIAQKSAAVGTATTGQIVVGIAATSTALVSASTTTTGSAIINGFIRISAAGTLIPQVALGVAAAAVVAANSRFRIVPAALSTVVSSGAWS